MEKDCRGLIINLFISMEVLNQFVLGSFFLIGFVNIVNMGLEGNWKGFVKAMLAVVAGGVLGYLKFYNIPSVEMGIALGIASSGVYKGFQIGGGKE